MAPDDPLDTYDPENNPAHASQLHVNIERIRVPEVLWQPQMGGLDQAGLGEVVEGVLKRFTEEERRRLTQVRLFVFAAFPLHIDSSSLLRLPAEHLCHRRQHPPPRLRQPPHLRPHTQPPRRPPSSHCPLSRRQSFSRSVARSRQVVNKRDGEESLHHSR
jgi:hypothetical protein